MPKMVQIRNVPDDLHRKVKARAAEEGLTLSEYLLREMRRSAERPTMRELVERVRARRPARLPHPPSQFVRELRDSQ